jgi:hypothetical protein
MEDRPSVFIPKSRKTFKVMERGVLIGTVYEKFQGEAEGSILERATEMYKPKTKIQLVPIKIKS